MTIPCAISGSFKRNLTEIGEYMQELEKNGFQILSPTSSEIRRDDDDFILLQSDKKDNPWQIELLHLGAISRASVLIVVNPKNYIGFSVNCEIGYALGLGKIITFSDEVPDFFVHYPFAFSFNGDVTAIRGNIKNLSGRIIKA
jgi:hypothetical protein